MDQISMHELYKKSSQLGEDEVVLDVRKPDEYAEGHVHGSINITHEDVASKATELQKYKSIYIHCRGGGRAQKAYAALTEAGLNNLICITGSGMKDWIEAGYPIDK